MCCHCINRREFLGVTTAMTLAAAMGASAKGAAAWSDGYWDPSKPLYTQGRTLRVQPVLGRGDGPAIGMALQLLHGGLPLRQRTVARLLQALHQPAGG